MDDLILHPLMNCGAIAYSGNLFACWHIDGRLEMDQVSNVRSHELLDYPLKVGCLYTNYIIINHCAVNNYR